ncbi:MAG: ABC-2 family transporter protein, partial [Candidatus Hydrothermae bacterium]|nr:ABC-2 family transporter protein [Candidatus Hydrothermae bacterium]
TFARYFLSVYLTRQLTVVWVIYEFEGTVLKGTLSYYLLQPVPVVLRFVSSHLAERLARLPFMMGLVLLFFLLYPRAFWLPDPAHVLAFLVLVNLAFALRFLIQYTLSMLAFWTERAVSVDEFFFLAYLFLSGMIAPLEVFPEALRRVLLWTPFPYLVYTPARALMGGPVPWAQVMPVMIGWAVVFWAVYRVLWTRGLHHYSGMGA